MQISLHAYDLPAFLQCRCVYLKGERKSLSTPILWVWGFLIFTAGFLSAIRTITDGSAARERGHLASEPHSAPVSWQAWWMQADEHMHALRCRPESSLSGPKTGRHSTVIHCGCVCTTRYSITARHTWVLHLISCEQRQHIGDEILHFKCPLHLNYWCFARPCAFNLLNRITEWHNTHFISTALVMDLSPGKVKYTIYINSTPVCKHKKKQKYNV